MHRPDGAGGRLAGREANTGDPCAAPKEGAGGGTMGSPALNRGAQIRTGDLSDPNGARYQAAPHPEPRKGSGSRFRRLAPWLAGTRSSRTRAHCSRSSDSRSSRRRAFRSSARRRSRRSRAGSRAPASSSSGRSELGAELVLVHHGLFWRNEPLVVDARLRGRLEALFRGDASLVAYHLALDAHPTLGNNAQLARANRGDARGGVRVAWGSAARSARLARRARRPRRGCGGADAARAPRRRPRDPQARRLDRAARATTSSMPRTRATTRSSPESPRSRAAPRRASSAST